MKRIDMIKIVGEDYHTENIENGEWSYATYMEKAIGHYKLDLRFVNENIAVLIETKPNFKETDSKQLFDYVSHEFNLIKTKNIIAILADTRKNSNRIKVWKIINGVEELLENETSLRSFDEYAQIFEMTIITDKNKVMQATYELNELLHNYLKEDKRAQFVGTCLLALKNGLIYENLTNTQIRAGIKDILSHLLGNNLNKAEKLTLLNNNILETSEVSNISNDKFEEILKFIEINIYPYINDNENQGQDLLNLFFTSFNKYVGKADKNQAFTPDHIVHFMCKVAGINRNSVVLDPTSGSGAFLVQAMVQAMNDCPTDSEKNNVKEKQIYGIELDEKAFGLSTTNMLIHGDGNSNIYNDSCFTKMQDLFQIRDLDKFIKDDNRKFTKEEIQKITIENPSKVAINTVLMNPPYNAKLKDVPNWISNHWKIKKTANGKKIEKATTDPSKGFSFVYETSKYIQQNGKLLCLLPLACAIGSTEFLKDYKKKMLDEHTLEAVYSLPSDIFYPGASANVCCMEFTIGNPHPKNHKTFFGYYKKDGFIKKKNLGRVDTGEWKNIEKQWIELRQEKDEVTNLSVKHNISPDNTISNYESEWLAEAYMETDYSKLTDETIEKTIRDYIAHKIIFGGKYNA
jgi:Type I restriction-modification system methyltransferase subunit